jgi:hypothetical protein
MARAESATAGVSELREEVFEIIHCRIWLAVPSVEKTASELRKFSVPECALS